MHLPCQIKHLVELIDVGGRYMYFSSYFGVFFSSSQFWAKFGVKMTIGPTPQKAKFSYFGFFGIPGVPIGLGFVFLAKYGVLGILYMKRGVKSSPIAFCGCTGE